MVLYKFSLDMVCPEDNNIDCPITEDIASKFSDIDPTLKLIADSDIDDVQGHISVSHKPHDHQVWVFVYDDDGIHESADSTTGAILKQSNSRIKSFKKPKPTEALVRSKFLNIKAK